MGWIGLDWTNNPCAKEYKSNFKNTLKFRGFYLDWIGLDWMGMGVDLTRLDWIWRDGLARLACVTLTDHERDWAEERIRQAGSQAGK